eukprot:2812203-Karenia_brevis.AAC.1
MSKKHDNSLNINMRSYGSDGALVDAFKILKEKGFVAGATVLRSADKFVATIKAFENMSVKLD